MKANEFENKFDDGESILDDLDLSQAKRVGVTRQSIIKIWLAERLEHTR
jgi:hypothetical protein